MTQEELYLGRCQAACNVLYRLREKHAICAIIVYGSMARGRLGMSSDIDVMVLFDCKPEERRTKERALRADTPLDFDCDFPYIDLRAVRVEAYKNYDSNTEYGKYLENCRREGIPLWIREGYSI